MWYKITMTNNIFHISPDRKKLVVCVALVLVTLAVYWQVNHYDFVNLDDDRYVTGNTQVAAGMTPDTVRWALVTMDVDGMWHPLVWLSFLSDYHLFGLHAGGYHLTNLIFHILSSVLLFWLFHRMTKNIWPSAFVAALFALHPLHVESVAWISERKDVLSAFFWMLTLSLYVFYTEKPAAGRYLPVLFSFVLALMSKPMVVTLPLILILLDYWPLGRFASRKGGLVLWQLKEKSPFLILSVLFSVITVYGQQGASYIKNIPLSARLANVPVALVTYLEKTFLPHAMTVFYPFPAQIPAWQVIAASVLILFITLAAVVTAKRMPYFFTGWFWFAVTIAPVSGIIQSGEQAMADRYHYLPSIGVAVAAAWGIASLVKSETVKRKFLFPAGIIFLAVMAFLSWRQCGYWSDSYELWNHALSVTEDNYLAHDSMGQVLAAGGEYTGAVERFNAAISIAPDFVNAYYNRGTAYIQLQQYQKAIDDFTRAIDLKPSDAVYAFSNRGAVYYSLGRFREAIADYSEAIRLKADDTEAYYNRGLAHLQLGENAPGCRDAQKACDLGKCDLLGIARDKGYCR
jgi:Flp pilus assembly protein TadD